MSKIFAEVIPYIRSIPNRSIFDYEIPATCNYQVGDIVTINFRHREIIALIFKIKKNSLYTNIKPILNKIPNLSLTAKQLNLLSFLAQKYQIALTLAFKTIFPEISKKITVVNKISDLQKAKKYKINNQRINIIRKSINQAVHSDQPIILHTNIVEEKYAFLLGILKKIPPNKQLLIVVPEIKDIEIIASFFSDYSPTILHSGLNKATYWINWLKIKQRKTRLIIGTKVAIFVPPDSIERIVIDDEEDKSHSNYDQNPKYHVLEIARQITNKIILISRAPTISSSYKFSSIELLGRKNIIEIVDLNREKAQGNYSFFSERLLAAVNSAKKSLLIFNRKGEAKWLLCKQCQEVLPFATTTHCPHCHNYDLKKISYGLKKLLRDLKKIFPLKKIIEVSTDTKSNILSEFDIVIGTDYALRKINIDDINLIGVISLDHQLAIPVYDSAEKVWQEIAKIVAFFKPTIIQTHCPDNIVIKTAINQDYKTFYQFELQQRRQFHLPPF